MGTLHYIEKADFINISLYQYALFHGSGTRPDAPYPLYTYRLGEELNYPLRLSRNVFRIPPVFQPVTNLVVCEDLNQQLKKLPNLQLLEVQFERLFFLPFDQSPGAGGPAIQDVEEFLEKQPHRPELESEVGRYYELIVPLYSRLQLSRSKLKKVRIGRPGLKTLDIRTSDDVLATYPIFWWEGHLLNEQAYEILAPYLDRSYFDCISEKI